MIWTREAPRHGARHGAPAGPDTASKTAGHTAGHLDFRPDIQGLRTIAVLAVALYHANVPGIASGYVGVDIFFVISGFLITSLLLREGNTSDTISIARFYARRARRILPAASLVIIVTVLASYHWLGFLVGNAVATDGKWAGIFAGNLHLAAVGASYLGSQAQPSPLQHMWSLGVEEQFYVVWPLIVLITVKLAPRHRLRRYLGIVLAVLSIVSLVWCITQTSTNGTVAYYSPLTRGWELGAGGLVAIAAPVLPKIPARVAVPISYLAFALMIASAFVYSDSTTYPGSAAMLPVLSAAVLIAVGARGVLLRVLSIPPVQWLGSRSYSFYLWHWPFLIIPLESAGHDLSVWQNLLWLLGALVASEISYRIVENPIRRWSFLAKKKWWGVLFGVVLVAVVLVVCQAQLAANFAGWNLRMNDIGYQPGIAAN